MRTEYLLDKDWKFKEGIDLTDGEGVNPVSSKRSKSGGVVNYGGTAVYDGDWCQVDVPHDYITKTPFDPEEQYSHGYKHRHNAWYRKTFVLPQELEGKHVLLDFEGMAVEAVVYFNGSLVGRSFSAYVPLALDLTERAYFGDTVNTLAVFINGKQEEGWWYEGAGIYRHVRLYVKELCHIAHDGVFVKPVCQKDLTGVWNTEVTVRVENSAYEAQKARVRVTLYDAAGNTVETAMSDVTDFAPDSLREVKLSLPLERPHLWDVTDPTLYRAEVELVGDNEVLDAVGVKYGYRTFTADKDTGFYLNGKPIKLKGICNHQDHAGVGIAVPDAIQYYRIQRLKELGSNAYRCSHNLPAKEILNACDELGLLVMDENRRFETRPEVLSCVETMVRRDGNHPSVVMYSLFNEEPLEGKPEGARIFQKMASFVRKIDDSRLLLGACCSGYNNPDGVPSVEDIVGINYGVPNYVAQHKKLYPNHIVFGSESCSTLSTRGCYVTDVEKCIVPCTDSAVPGWGQTIRENWDFTRSHDWFGGIFIWTGFDYRGEPTPYKWPSISSQFGIMDTCGFAKDSFYFNQACFLKEPVLHLLPHWNHTPGETVHVMAVSNCEEVELFLNEKSLGRKPNDCVKTAEWDVAYEAGILSAVGYNAQKEVAHAEEYTAGDSYRLVLDVSKSVLKNDGEDAAAVNVSVLDKNGHPVRLASEKIKFTIQGDGVLLGVGNGDPNCHESDVGPERSLFNGHAQGIVQTTLGAKHLSVLVEGEGLLSATVTFEIQDVCAPSYLFSSVRSILSPIYVSMPYDERPDPLVPIAEDDVNSLDILDDNPWDYQPRGFTKGYHWYRASFTIPPLREEGKQCSLFFKGTVASDLALYINGKCVFEGDPAQFASYTDLGEWDRPKHQLSFTFPATPGKQEMRLLIKADDQPSGIIGEIIYKIV